MRNRLLRRIKLLMAMMLILSLILPVGISVAASEGETATKTAEFQTFDELDGKTISMITGAPFEEMISSKVPNVGEFTYYQSSPDMMLGIKSGKTDAGLMNNAVAELVVNRDPELAIFPQSLGDTAFGLAFPKGDDRCKEWQKVYDGFSAETKTDLWKKWTGADDSIKTVPEQDWPGANGTVKVAACDALEPMSYVGEGGELLGLDIETILLIAKELDVHVEFTPMDFAAVLASIGSGKADIGCGSIVTTDERRETMDFIEYQPASFVLIVRSTGEAGTGGASTGSFADGGGGLYESFAELKGKKIGVVQGTWFDKLTEEKIDDVQLVYLNSSSDLVSSLESCKIDGFAVEEPIVRMIMKDDDKVTYIKDSLNATDFAFITNKSGEGNALNAKLSEFVKKIKSDGTLDEIEKTWFGTDEDKKTVEDYKAFPATNGTIKVATSASMAPFSYVKDNVVVGYEIDMLARFCKEYGYRLEPQIMDFGAIIPQVQTGKSDVGASAISITEERKESVDFTEPYYKSYGVIAVMKKDISGGSIFDSLRDSFEKTFIREDRYKLFIEGIVTTLIIVVLSILFGTFLGFAVYMLCRRGNKVANLISRFFIWLVLGMPVVVLLMILYYIIFAKASISGTFVAVIAFTLVFGSAMFGMLKSGVGAIDIGQTEAAYALGYGELKTFFRIILPQAIPHFLPAYKGEVVSLIKSSAIVGYIAVQDLTKMGDIIRGRTYEAFFPLIAVAIIYFILAGILNFIVGRIEKRLNPRRRKKDSILKGVKTDD